MVCPFLQWSDANTNRRGKLTLRTSSTRLLSQSDNWGIYNVERVRRFVPGSAWSLLHPRDDLDKLADYGVVDRPRRCPNKDLILYPMSEPSPSLPYKVESL
jgi:hypothetical protein